MSEADYRSHDIEELPDVLRREAEQVWVRFESACRETGRQMPGDPSLLRALRLAFAFSGFAGGQALRDPAAVVELMETGDMGRSYPEGRYREKLQPVLAAAASEEDLEGALRRFRNREMIRIAVRDLSGMADLFETMADLSGLAEACIDGALMRLFHWMTPAFGTPSDSRGRPLHPVVLGVGKLGGRELNFSSDVDLLFAFPEGGQTRDGGRTLTHEEFFSKLFRQLIGVLSKNTPAGFVFRVDARLRPYGDSGPIAMNFESFETYYQEQGREWERYALIKARPVAGDIRAGRHLIERLRPFVYRRYLDFGTFEDLREMKRKIVREVSRKGLSDNIKLGAGGIREIEFFGQVFQLIRGGVNPDYQSRNILATLSRLSSENCIPRAVYQELGQAYAFLRDTEHRLQMAGDRQTHTLPKEDLQRRRLALSMGFADWEEFRRALSAHMGRVHSHFNELLADPGQNAEKAEDTAVSADELWQNLGEPETAERVLSAMGFPEPAPVRKVLEKFLDMPEAPDVSSRGKDRMYRLLPRILKTSAGADNPAMVLQRVLELVRAIRSRSCYMALLLENPDALTHLVGLAAASSWVVSFLARHPLLLDELLDPRSLYLPLGKPELEKEIRHRLDRVAPGDLERQMDELRVFKQSHTLRIAAADVAGLIPLMKVSDRLTYLAETVIDVVLELSWEHLVEKYGAPVADAEGGGKGFAVIAYGKLGGFELGYGSDLDLVFLHAAPSGSTGGGRLPAIDNHQFYVRLGQRVIHFLTTMTSTGKLYEADMRLRPSGEAGVLVSRVEAFEEYQKSQAWTWEHQALIKARPISGDASVGRRFEEIRRHVLTARRRSDALRGEVRQMRERMRSSRRDAGGRHLFDIKNDPGGIVDIEFLVQYLILLHASEEPVLVQWTDVVRQLNSLALAGVIEDRAAHVLKQAYLAFRYLVHRLSLEQKPAAIEAGRLTEHRRRVRRIWRQYL
jgi:glutamate-ammonia-ligase adenylyltransferase